mmetsp:Transcript_29867/g.5395  ORF Transcript_29867/g.5395 Transcript_29867/m.5395 type:complete len:120 (+) Transcript_29867:259-618(+)
MCGVLHCLGPDMHRKLTEKFSMCVNNRIQSKEQLSRCQAVEGVTKADLDNGNISGSGGMSIWLILFLLIIGSVSIMLIVAITYYRYMLNKYGQAPFSVPYWCPNCLFPKDNFQRVTRIY